MLKDRGFSFSLFEVCSLILIKKVPQNCGSPSNIGDGQFLLLRISLFGYIAKPQDMPLIQRKKGFILRKNEIDQDIAGMVD
jgi:hypothetical protein